MRRRSAAAAAAADRGGAATAAGAAAPAGIVNPFAVAGTGTPLCRPSAAAPQFGGSGGGVTDCRWSTPNEPPTAMSWLLLLLCEVKGRPVELDGGDTLSGAGALEGTPQNPPPNAACAIAEPAAASDDA
ncbi:unnamed protein product [Closterium sp. NIES-54]